MTQGLGRRHALWVGAAIFVAALALRVALVQTTRFTGDEARDYSIGVAIADGAPAPLLGPEVSSGSARLPGPLQYWLAAFPQLFTRAPEAGNLFFELMGAASVWLFWLTLRRPFGEPAAAFAAGLMALSPWSALFGDRVWNPNAFLFFACVALLAAVKLRERPTSAWAAVLLVACLALPQLHMSALVVWLGLLPLVARPLRQAPRRTLVLGVALGALLYLPLAIHEAKTGFGNTRAFVLEALAIGGRKNSAVDNVSFLLTPAWVLRVLTLDVTYHELTGYWGGLDEAAAWRALWLGSEARPFHPLRLAALLASLALVIASIVIAGREIWRRRAGGRWRSAFGPYTMAALVAVAADMLFLGITRKKIFAHYITPTLPFVFMLYAAAARRALADPRLRPWLLVLGVGFAAGGVEATLSISRRIDGRNGLAVHRAVAQRLLDDCAAAGRTPQACPARLDFGYFAVPYSHNVFAHHALARQLRWERGAAGFAYRVQKRADPPPTQAAAFPATRVGAVTIYRLK
jgi:hypothetical protein